MVAINPSHKLDEPCCNMAHRPCFSNDKPNRFVKFSICLFERQEMSTFLCQLTGFLSPSPSNYSFNHKIPIAISPLTLAMILISASRSSLMCTFKLPLTSLPLSSPKPSSSSSSSSLLLLPFFFLFFDLEPVGFVTEPMVEPTSGRPRPPEALPSVPVKLQSNQHLLNQKTGV